MQGNRWWYELGFLFKGRLQCQCFPWRWGGSYGLQNYREFLGVRNNGRLLKTDTDCRSVIRAVKQSASHSVIHSKVFRVLHRVRMSKRTDVLQKLMVLSALRISFCRNGGNGRCHDTVQHPWGTWMNAKTPWTHQVSYNESVNWY
jgi:hypothetical protein